MRLFEIDARIMACVDMETGEIIDEELFNSLEMERDEKIENLACLVKNLTADAEAFKVQKQTFAERQKKAEDSIERFKAEISASLSCQRFSTDKVDISFRKTSSVHILEKEKIPEQYLKYAEPTADKMAIKAAIKAGEVVPGAEIVEDKSMSIK